MEPGGACARRRPVSVRSANRTRLLPLLAALVAVAAGCSLLIPSAIPAPSPSAGGGSPLGLPELKLALQDRFGQLWYCDPDFYPIARDDERDLAVQRFAEVRADGAAFAAVIRHLALNAGADFTVDQKLAVYRQWKILRAVVLSPIGNDRYRFDYRAMPANGAARGTRTAGIIDATGAISIDQQEPADEPPCPICLARGTLIDTPDGPVPVERLSVGSAVWTLDRDGRQVAAVVVALGSVAVPVSHRVVHLVLDDGRDLHASPGHPLADGRLLGTIHAGDRVDGARVVSADLEAYDGGATFDLLPSGPTGTYLAAGIPLGSTLRP